MKALSFLACIFILHAASGNALAQSPAEGERRAEQAVQREAARASEMELVEARAQLEGARAELERAAQELARLSVEHNTSVPGLAYNLANVFRPGRPLLGLNINNDEDGVRVIGVSPGGPGDGAGVEIGDLIVSIDDIEVDGSGDGNPTRRFLGVLEEIDAGNEVELVLIRDGEPLALKVETNESRMPAWLGDIGDRVNYSVREIPRIYDRNITRVMEQPYFFGPWSDMELLELTPGLGEYFGTDSGLLVVRAPEGDDIDLRDGDVILEIAGRTPQSVGHAMRILRSFEPDESMEVTIMREQRRRSVEVVR